MTSVPPLQLTVISKCRGKVITEMKKKKSFECVLGRSAKTLTAYDGLMLIQENARSLRT